MAVPIKISWFVVIFFVSNIFCYQAKPDATDFGTILVDGVERDFILYRPGTEKYRALVFVMHGYTSSASIIMSYSGMNEIALEENFLVVYPQGTLDQRGNAFFNVGYEFHADVEIDDEKFIKHLAMDLVKRHEIDPRNVFATGMSNGGDMSYLLACNASDIFSAIASVAGVMMKKIMDECRPERPLPVFEIHGTEDELSSFDGDIGNEDGWGPYYDQSTSIKYWVDQNGLEQREQNRMQDKDKNDGSSIIFERYWDDTKQSEVWFYIVEGGGHNWPGAASKLRWWKNPILWYFLQGGNRDVDSSREIWSFFERYLES